MTEKARVAKAFEQSRYYKYYQTLVDGKDQIKTVDITQIGQRLNDNGILISVYSVKVELQIDDKTFYRSTEWIAETEYTIVSDRKSKFEKYWGITWKVGLGILAGFAIGYAAGR